MVQTAELIKKYQLHEKDTGSTAVQIILLSKEIENLSSHFAKNKKDKGAIRALIKKNQKRGYSFYKYLKKNSPETFQKLQNEPKDLTKFLGIKQ
ncbi:30S ribosomal protein S15 [endosymbiont GvMRE of Glomus versiforme]|uniref:30S ribosomal protein S15 n=1 Tax=endosymbiont GvMRE of Glomus versiforme TaxID=2039283 RepID=UPI000EE8BD32|nr:30S ribosomal protein S15 [endosymbiont GvMRE of Glomus versiforme]RHZ36677.1 30S ribosomal protein S15 [endosymbiont GvMRE of Glomus versiforme]